MMAIASKYVIFFKLKTVISVVTELYILPSLSMLQRNIYNKDVFKLRFMAINQ